MVNSSLYERFYGDCKKKTGGSKIGFHAAELFKVMNEKKIFFILIFVNLLVQLGITYYAMETSTPPKGNATFWLLFIGSLLLIMAMILIPMPSFCKVVLFAAFSYVMGLLLAMTKKHNDQIRLAMQGALSVFAAMLTVGLGLLLTGIQLGYQFGLFLFVSLLLLLIARLVSIFSGTVSTGHLGLSIFGIVLFALYVMYDTNVIFRRDYSGDFITASLDYYLDILNLFTSLLGMDN